MSVPSRLLSFLPVLSSRCAVATPVASWHELEVVSSFPWLCATPGTDAKRDVRCCWEEHRYHTHVRYDCKGVSKADQAFLTQDRESKTHSCVLHQTELEVSLASRPRANTLDVPFLHFPSSPPRSPGSFSASSTSTVLVPATILATRPALPQGSVDGARCTLLPAFSFSFFPLSLFSTHTHILCLSPCLFLSLCF